jgi:prepilin-type N-terminal cleavage/methylation domain-containing protein
MSHRNVRRVSGFTLIETMLAITVLGVGLLAMAALIAKTAVTSSSSRYMSTQSLLASEKLDDLNRLSASDPDIAVTSGNTAGSLTSDSSQTVTVSGNAYPVDYFDQVLISNGNGAVTETLTSTNAGGGTVYTTITHSPDGQIAQTQSTTSPMSGPDTLLFKRRWVIEQDAPIVGVRRITVLVTVQAQPPSAPFQMSMVRP